MQTAPTPNGVGAPSALGMHGARYKGGRLLGLNSPRAYCNIPQMATLKVQIPLWHPARLNQWDGAHWAVRAQLKADDREMVGIFCQQVGVPHAKKKRRVSLHIILAPRQRAADPDAWWKSLLDALVACGALLDDSPRWVELGPVTYERGMRKATAITLEDAD